MSFGITTETSKCFFTQPMPFLPSVARRVGSRSSFEIARAVEWGSSGGTRKPANASGTTSATPPWDEFTPTTGFPAAIPSTKTIPKVSLELKLTTTSAAAKIAGSINSGQTVRRREACPRDLPYPQLILSSFCIQAPCREIRGHSQEAKLLHPKRGRKVQEGNG